MYRAIIHAGELEVAVANGFLTQEEARRVYQSQFPYLQSGGIDPAPPASPGPSSAV